MKKGTQIIYVPSHVNLRKVFSSIPNYIPDKQVRKYIKERIKKGGGRTYKLTGMLPEDCEEGFVTSIRGPAVFCRYWSKTHASLLRTTSCSEGTPKDRLFIVDTRPQHIIDTLMKRFEAEELGLQKQLDRWKGG